MTLQCELCASVNGLSSFEVASTKKRPENSITVCATCSKAIEDRNFSDTNHWRCLHEAIWNENSAVKVTAFRILSKIKSEAWAQDLFDQLYLEDEDLAWAQEEIEDDTSTGPSTLTLDSNGTPLAEGDSVTLIKDLDVKGGGFTAKRGTLVKNIKLTENPEHIEGRVNGIQIVLIAKFLKKV